MKKTSAILILGFALIGVAAAKDPAVKDSVKKDGTSAAPQVQTSPNAAKTDSQSPKGNVGPSASKEGTKDPYAVPLLKDAKPLN